MVKLKYNKAFKIVSGALKNEETFDMATAVAESMDKKEVKKIVADMYYDYIQAVGDYVDVKDYLYAVLETSENMQDYDHFPNDGEAQSCNYFWIDTLGDSGKWLKLVFFKKR